MIQREAIEHHIAHQSQAGAAVVEDLEAAAQTCSSRIEQRELHLIPWPENVGILIKGILRRSSWECCGRALQRLGSHSLVSLVDGTYAKKTNRYRRCTESLAKAAALGVS